MAHFVQAQTKIASINVGVDALVAGTKKSAASEIVAIETILAARLALQDAYAAESISSIRECARTETAAVQAKTDYYERFLRQFDVGIFAIMNRAEDSVGMNSDEELYDHKGGYEAEG